ncbi:hypothetical protein Tco_1113063 [Tanacetum coccineum]|uniref:Uncharacterized protein n=1 Tax=Tanacetum coccineum TaxID=301880 RepID=A0ABQ5ISL1_9ASTR
MDKEKIINTKTLSTKTTLAQPTSKPLTHSQVPVTETRYADEREMGDGIPTQSSATGGASDWSIFVIPNTFSRMPVIQVQENMSIGAERRGNGRVKGKNAQRM